jgi:hypothetical protein
MRLSERLLETGAVDCIVRQGGTLPCAACHLPLMDFAAVLDIGLDGVSQSARYLGMEQRPLRGDGSRPRIGVIWSADPRPSEPCERSVPARFLAGLTQDVDGDFVSLQRGRHAADLAALGLDDRVASEPAPSDDLLDVAIRLQDIDLLISVDCAEAHLAGALGVPVWLMLPFIPAWYWLHDRPSSPWYPSARLFRQRAHGDWVSVCHAVRAALAEQYPVAGGSGSGGPGSAGPRR